MAQKTPNRNSIPVSKTGKYVIDGGKVLNEKEYKAYVKKNEIQFEYVSENKK